jgi:glutamine amidotransferase
MEAQPGSPISIVDYGVANLGSICNMLRKLRFAYELVSSADGISNATKIILPGVGAFDHGMKALSSLDLISPLRERVIGDRVPILGICLGMQLLGEGSEEGSARGIGIVAASCVRFRFPPESPLKVPHMGWNELVVRRSSDLLNTLEDRSRFYFTHSYHLVCESQDDVLAHAVHGIEFTAAVQRENIMGVQFHPEKSHRFGITLLRNFGAS